MYQPAYIIYTLGSTGEPKGVVINHRAAWNTVVDINRRFAVSAQDRVLAVANPSFDFAMYDLFGVLVAGARKADPSHWAELITQHGVTLWSNVPAQLQMLADAAQLLPLLRLSMVSGDWVPLDLLAQLKSIAHQAQLIALGGATEAAIWSIFYPVAEVASHRLRGLLRGETDVRGILFPEGELSTAHAAYRDNLVSRSMNNIVITAVTTLAAARHKPLRILEVGAGVAGTASDLVPALAEYR